VPPIEHLAPVPGRIAPSPPSGVRRDIVETAERHGLSLFYAPSMRNGGDGPPEDRGNAILSSLPLSDLAAIELPFEHQRRVAVAAGIRVVAADGLETTLHVVSAHLDVQASWRRGRFLWFGRVRQARALLSAIETLPDPKVLGGDFNSWLGDVEPDVREARSRFPQTPAAGAHVTFPVIGAFGLHLDHLFFKLPAGWTASVSRIDDRWGSDHHPLVASFRSAG
jgi:endonuclease/exonuclease/phosphatase family metal-dependent hydrolase